MKIKPILIIGIIIIVVIIMQSGIVKKEGTGNWCVQESANVAMCGGGIGYYSFSGNTWSSPTNLYDGNWGTYSEDTSLDDGPSIMYVTYMKPVGASSSSIFSVKFFDWYYSEFNRYIIYNYTLNDAFWLGCWNYLPDRINLKISSNRGSSQSEIGIGCQYGLYDWRNHGYIRVDFKILPIYEESMRWFFPIQNTPADTDSNGYISNSELLTYTGLWTSGTVTNTQLLTSITAWVAG